MFLIQLIYVFYCIDDIFYKLVNPMGFKNEKSSFSIWLDNGHGPFHCFYCVKVSAISRCVWWIARCRWWVVRVEYILNLSKYFNYYKYLLIRTQTQLTIAYRYNYNISYNYYRYVDNVWSLKYFTIWLKILRKHNAMSAVVDNTRHLGIYISLFIMFYVMFIIT